MNVAKKQDGAVTIIMSAVILFLLSMISVFAARVTVTDHRIASNLYRSAQSKTAGHAAIEEALTMLSGRQVALSGGATTDLFSNTVDGECPGISGGDTGRFCVRDVDGAGVGIARAQFTAVAASPLVNLTISSWSPDGVAQKTLAQSVLHTQALQDAALDWPLIVRGNFNGTAMNILNMSNGDAVDRAVWAGNVVGAANTTLLNAAPGQGQFSDGGLAALATADATYDNFFRFDQPAISSRATQINCGGGCNRFSPQITPMIGTGGIFWLTGDLDLNGNVALGTENDPILLIVDGGNLSLTSASGIINGTVFVLGNWNDNGSDGTINGNLIVGGSMTETGSLNINYSDDAGGATTPEITAVENIGIYTKVAGTWRDF